MEIKDINILEEKYTEIKKSRNLRVPVKMLKEAGFEKLPKLKMFKQISYDKIPLLVADEYFASASVYELAKSMPDAFLHLSESQLSYVKERIFMILPFDVLNQLVAKCKNYQPTTEYIYHRDKKELYRCTGQPSLPEKLRTAIRLKEKETKNAAK